MSRSKSVWLAAVSTFVAAVGIGCAVPTSDPAPSEGTSSTSSAMNLTGLNPCNSIKPTYLLRLQGPSSFTGFGPYYSEYQVAFPTPWVIDARFYLTRENVVDEPDVYTYEHLQSALTSNKGYEYLVKQVWLGACPNTLHGSLSTGPQCITSDTPDSSIGYGKLWFTTPFSSWSDFSSALTNVNTSFSNGGPTYAANQDTQAQLVECATIVDGQDLVGAPVTVVESDPFVDVHDPHDPPF